MIAVVVAYASTQSPTLHFHQGRTHDDYRMHGTNPNRQDLSEKAIDTPAMLSWGRVDDPLDTVDLYLFSVRNVLRITGYLLAGQSTALLQSRL